MTVQVIYKTNIKLTNKGIFAIFTDENFKPFQKKKLLSNFENEYTKKILKTKSKEKKIISFDISSEKTLILIATKKNSTNNDFENLGRNRQTCFSRFVAK